MITALFVSRVRVKLLEIFLLNPGRSFYVRQLVREIGEEVNSVRRELGLMKKHKMVSSEWRGNRLYYTFRPDYSFYPELLRMFNKIGGLGGAILRNRAKLGKIKYAMLTSKFIRGRRPQPKEVVLLIVGEIVLPQLASLIKTEEARKGFEINYTVMSEEEFSFRKQHRDPFLLGILSQGRLMLVGDEDEMLEGL